MTLKAFASVDYFYRDVETEREMQQGHMQIVTDIKAGRMTFND